MKTRQPGLFEKKMADRNIMRGLSELHQGCTYPYFSEAMDIPLGCGATLFDMFHGYCWFFAKYFQHKNPGWEAISAVDDKEFIIHTFLTKRENGIRLFADARGVTDNPEEFFTEFNLSKATRFQKDTEEMPLEWFNESYNNAYRHIFG